MMKPLQIAVSAAFLSVTVAGAAHAALLDFTDSSWSDMDGQSSYAFDVGGISGTITSSPTLINLTDWDGGTNTQGLVGNYDGIGISPGDGDEVGGSEALTITFDSSVNVTRIDFLDLFKTNDSDYEQVSVSASDGTVFTFSQNTSNTGTAGYFTTADTWTGFAGINSLTFSAVGPSDDTGSRANDFALAAVEVAAVPIPAALPLFLSALAGLGFVGFRRRKI